jgi:hypothetical protein
VSINLNNERSHLPALTAFPARRQTMEIWYSVTCSADPPNRDHLNKCQRYFFNHQMINKSIVPKVQNAANTAFIPPRFNRTRSSTQRLHLVHQRATASPPLILTRICLCV